MPTIRHAESRDIEALRELYGHHLATVLPPERPLSEWLSLLGELIADENYHLLVSEVDGSVVATVTLVVVRNLTHGLRPYAVIENVVTHAEHRKSGCGTALIAHACELARERNCYKVMLMTGSKEKRTLRFYERCGFNRHDKTGFIMKL